MLHAGNLAERRFRVPWIDAKSARIALFVSWTQSIERAHGKPSGQLAGRCRAIRTLDDGQFADHTDRQGLTGTRIENPEPSRDGLQRPALQGDRSARGFQHRAFANTNSGDRSRFGISRDVAEASIRRRTFRGNDEAQLPGLASFA